MKKENSTKVATTCIVEFGNFIRYFPAIFLQSFDKLNLRVGAYQIVQIVGNKFKIYAVIFFKKLYEMFFEKNTPSIQ